AERAPGLAEGDVETQQARLVLALERDQVPAGVEHGDGERRATGVAALLECGVDDGRGLRERDGHRDPEVDERAKDSAGIVAAHGFARLAQESETADTSAVPETFRLVSS